MPHCVIEYSKPLRKKVNIKQLTDRLHHTLNKSGLFAIENIKTRAIGYDDYVIGDSEGNQDFVHVRIYILKGKSVQVQKTLSQQIWRSVKSEIPFIESLTVDVREMDKEAYTKYLD